METLNTLATRVFTMCSTIRPSHFPPDFQLQRMTIHPIRIRHCQTRVRKYKHLVSVTPALILPSVVLRCPVDQPEAVHSMPVSLQLVARRLEEEKVLSMTQTVIDALA